MSGEKLSRTPLLSTTCSVCKFYMSYIKDCDVGHMKLYRHVSVLVGDVYLYQNDVDITNGYILLGCSMYGLDIIESFKFFFYLFSYDRTLRLI